MSWQRIKALDEEIRQLQADQKAILDKVETETRADANRAMTAEETAKFDELFAKEQAKTGERDRFQKVYKFEQRSKEELEQRRQQPGRDDLDTPEKRAEALKLEQRKAFDHYLRHGLGGEETRALTVQGVGGVVGDRPFYDQLVLGMKAYSGCRQAGATVISSSDGNTITVPFLDDTNNIGQIVAEGTTDNTTADASSGFISLGAYKHDSKWLKLSTELVQDSAFPVEATVLSMGAERIGRIFNRYTTTGTGTGQPKGINNAATLGATAAATNAIVYDELINLDASLDPAYKALGKCSIMMNSTTLAACRKLRDGNGRYIFEPGVPGAPQTILGYPIVLNPDMPQLTSGAGSVVAALGDFSRYFIRDVTSPLIIVARELFAGDGMIGYRIFQRMDGNLADVNAIKLLKTAAS